jgi:phage shock protein A
MRPKDMEVFYRQALTKQQNAREQLARLQADAVAGAQSVTSLTRAIRQLDRAIMATQDAQRAASVKYGFAIKIGVGPGDWQTHIGDTR